MAVPDQGYHQLINLTCDKPGERAGVLRAGGLAWWLEQRSSHIFKDVRVS